MNIKTIKKPFKEKHFKIENYDFQNPFVLKIDQAANSISFVGDGGGIFGVMNIYKLAQWEN